MFGPCQGDTKKAAKKEVARKALCILGGTPDLCIYTQDFKTWFIIYSFWTSIKHFIAINYIHSHNNKDNKQSIGSGHLVY